MGGAWLTNVDLGCVFMGCDVRRLTRKSLASNHERLAMDVPAVERQVGGYRNRTCSANTPFLNQIYSAIPELVAGEGLLIPWRKPVAGPSPACRAISMSHSIMVYGQHRSGTIFRIIVNRYDVTVNNVSKLKAKIMICEQCGNEHDGSYGSGRFCSKSCKCAFNAKKVKNHKCNFKPKHSLHGTWKCSHCGLVFDTRKLLNEHKHNEHPVPKGQAWNKGLTKELDPRIAKYAETHKKHISEGLVKLPWSGKHLPDEVRKKISASMKKAHAEGRAHNIGECRWNNEPSWPEKWFMQVIENEFTDKNYVRERPFHRFSLDFAWEHKKKCIELDGKQHEVFQEQIERDLRKNELLKEEGWQLLRLKWKEVFHEPKKYIQIAKEFIDG